VSAPVEPLEGVPARSLTRQGAVLRAEIDTDAILPLHQRLQPAGYALELLLALDRRTELAAFQLVYLYQQLRGPAVVEVTVGVPVELQPGFPSLATRCFPASRFEREIHDLLGLLPRGHPDLRRLVLHQFWPLDHFPLRKDAPAVDPHDDGTPFPFQQVEGEGVYEIPVGPVHAGVIEPGHFRFSAVGETIVDLKPRLGFVHRGIEKLLEGRTAEAAIELCERISGDTAVGHALAFCEAIELACGCEPPPRGALLRALYLEMERLYNHVSDLGFLAGDAGFGVGLADALAIKERLMRLNQRLCGHRLLRGGVAPGGVARDLPADLDLAGALSQVGREFDRLIEMILGHTMVLDRFLGTGVLRHARALDLGVVGPVARASGIDRDARRDRPARGCEGLVARVPVYQEGDVQARARVRIDEFRESLAIIDRILRLLPPGELRRPMPAIRDGASGFGIVEGWRGAIVHWVRFGRGGALERVKIRDPSFLNWPALPIALQDNIVPDFPLCNKSFNLSYAGNDL
jgi:Ni,Fe-hydrogenase III large subunit/Ni,Fe-hydrogenase III component G